MTASEDAATAFAYHERTKHHHRRFARSLGYLDWANQPEPFREFDGAERVPLELAPAIPEVAYDSLYAKAARDPGPLTAACVGDLLRHSLALSAVKQAGPSRWALRVNPSSGNLHPTEGYLLLPALDGVGDAPGTYHYRPRDHALERRAAIVPEDYGELTRQLPPGSFLVGLTSVHWREAWKYGERAFRYCQHDLGHALAALRFAAMLTGRHLRVLPGWPHDAGRRLLGLDRDEDFPVDEEREEFEALAVVSPVPLTGEPAPPSGALLERIAGAAWSGQANVLSESHQEWPVIEEVAAATRRPESVESRAVPSGSLPSRPGGRRPLDAREIIQRRRSAVMFDGRSSIDLGGFLRILHRTLPGEAPPWDALPGRPAIHLALFVHRVESLAPGLYLLLRDADAGERLREAMRPGFAWRRPDGVSKGLPLRLLIEGDCRAAAAQLSCTQAIAGASFFSLGMVADFEAAVSRGRYRQLFWEAGMVGQVLYLEAEAEGARGTGIGCYFDDPVHETLGLSGREFQSLYHFTVGIPVEDERLTTLPPYPAPRG
jgi:SagB-type dehydrogenase family enzyme